MLESDRMICNGDKILALPGGEYHDILDNFYDYLSNKYQCNFIFLVNTTNYTLHENIPEHLASYVCLPDLLQEQTWEKDPNEVDRLNRLLRDCEKTLGIPMSRIILSNERSFGRRSSKLKYYWQEGQIARRVLGDESIADICLLRCLYTTFNLLAEHKPKYIIGGIAGATFNMFVYIVAKHLGIPCYSCVESMFLGDTYTWTSTWGSYPEYYESVFSELQDSQVMPSKSSLQKIDDFVAKPTVLPVYARFWSKNRKKVTLIDVAKTIYDRLKYRIIPILKNQKINNPKPILQNIVAAVRGYITSRTQRHFYTIFSSEALGNTKYVYYPMHQEPEFVLNTRATSWFNQINTIQLLSHNLPAGYRLIVKEHRYNYLRRPTRYLKEIRMLRNVDLVDPYDDQFKYITNADLVVTVNGTTGFEALMLEKPVITLSRTFYDVLDLAHKVDDINRIGEVILALLSEPRPCNDSKERIARLMDAEKIATFSIDDHPSEAEKLLKIYHQFKTDLIDKKEEAYA